VKANRGIDSSFRRNRGTLIMPASSSASPAPSSTTRASWWRSHPGRRPGLPDGHPREHDLRADARHVDRPLRLFAVDLAVKKAAVYGVVGTGSPPCCYVVTRTVERAFNLADLDTSGWFVPLGSYITVC